MSTRSLLPTLLSLVFALSVHQLGRRQKLSFRYAVGWMILGVLGVFASLLVRVAEPIAEELRVAPSALLAGVAIVLVIILCVQLSISISGLQEQIRQLAEEAAFLRQEIEEGRIT